jgi:hypothetical protein
MPYADFTVPFSAFPWSHAGQSMGDSVGPVMGALLYDLVSIKAAYRTQTAFYALALASLLLLGYLAKAALRNYQLQPSLPCHALDAKIHKYKPYAWLGAEDGKSKPPPRLQQQHWHAGAAAHDMQYKKLGFGTAGAGGMSSFLDLKMQQQKDQASRDDLLILLCPENDDPLPAASNRQQPALLPYVPASTTAVAACPRAQQEPELLHGAGGEGLHSRRVGGSGNGQHDWDKDSRLGALPASHAGLDGAQHAIHPPGAAVVHGWWGLGGVLEVRGQHSSSSSSSGGLVWQLLQQWYVLGESGQLLLSQMLRGLVDVVVPLAMHTTRTW